MTTTTKTKKPTKRRAGKKPDLPPLPPSSDVVQIAGQDYIITPLGEYAEWYEDQLFGALVVDRMAKPGQKIVPFAEIEAKLDKKKRGK